jgi:hypothetical protein
VYAPSAGKSGDDRLQLRVHAGLLPKTDHWTR